MGRQWLHAKRLVAGLKKGRTTGKLVREISVAAKMGGADPTMNARLFTAVEKAKKESVTKDAIQRAINKGAGIGDIAGDLWPLTLILLVLASLALMRFRRTLD